MIISAKTLSGEIITLESKDESDFEKKYKDKYIKEKYHSFVSIKFLELDGYNIIINVYDIPVFVNDIYQKLIENKKYERLIEEFSLNSHPCSILEIKKILNIKNITNEVNLKDIHQIFSNKNAIDIIRDLIKDIRIYNRDDLRIINLAKNTNSEALDILKMFNLRLFGEKMWTELCCNPNKDAFDIVIENIDYIKSIETWNIISYLSLNKSDEAMIFLKNNKQYIYWPFLSENDNDIAIELLLSNSSKIKHNKLCRNSHPEAVKIIIQILEEEGFKSKKIEYYNLFQNTSELMINYLVKNIENIDKRMIKNGIGEICENKSAIPLIKKIFEDDNLYKEISNKNNINEMTYRIFSNPSIFRDEDIFI